MRLFLALPIVFCAAIGPSSAQDVPCGEAGKGTCVPAWGLYFKRSEERKNLEEVYRRYILKYNNKANSVYSDPVANAIKQTLDGATREDIDFWVIVRNPTDGPVEVKYYVARGTKPFEIRAGSDLNCKIFKNACLPGKFNNPLDNTETVVSEAIKDLLQNGVIVSEVKIQVPPHSAKARGIAAGRDNEWKSGEQYLLALLTSNAPNRVVFDPRDVLRLGLRKAE